MRVAIVDDEPIARDILEQYVGRVDGLELASVCRTAVDAFNVLHKDDIDLIFLDIEMPDMDGLSLLRSLRKRPKVILTSAYRKYAVEAYEWGAVDYLLKPVPFDRFLKAVNRVMKRRAERQQLPHQRMYLYFKSGKKMVQVFLDEILYIESLSNYVQIHSTHKEKIVTYQKMEYLEQLLPSAEFIRIHRSHIVRKDKIRAFASNHIELNRETKLPVGGSYRDNVHTMIHNVQLSA